MYRTREAYFVATMIPRPEPLDFFYWGCLKEKFSKELIRNKADLRRRIHNAAREIRERRLARFLKR